MTKDEALRLAWDALEDIGDEWGFTSQRTVPKRKEAITAIKEALANEALDKMAENARELGLDYEPEQPKVRTGNCLRVGVCASEGHKIAPQRTWVGLTDEDISEIVRGTHNTGSFVRAIEAKLKEKNF
jgi:predicted transcriptional regulator